MARRALGRGLGALISGKPKKAATVTTEAEFDPAEGLVNLPIDKIVPSPWQPRQDFDERKLRQLADSIREQGLVQPVVVRRDGDQYELIAGERRFRAVQRLEEKTIPAVISNAAEDRIRELALVENLQRDDLNPIETAIAYKALSEEHEFTHEQVAKRLGVSRARITNTLRLLELPDVIKSMVSHGEISAGHGRCILGLPNQGAQIKMANKVINEKLSVREVEAMVSAREKPAAPTAKSKKTGDKAAHIRDLEDRLRSHLGTKVSVNDRKGKGTITIEYYTPTDVTRLLTRFGVPGDPM